METRTIKLDGIRAGEVEFLRARVPSKHRTPFAQIDYRKGREESTAPYDMDKQAIMGELGAEMGYDNLKAATDEINERISTAMNGAEIDESWEWNPEEHSRIDNDFEATLKKAS